MLILSCAGILEVIVGNGDDDDDDGDDCFVNSV